MENTCSKCNGHGGKYDINPRDGEIFGIPCEDCQDIESEEVRSEYAVFAKAALIGKDIKDKE